ncbi:hypothetical protein HanRHA438_Chr04g0195431 [Helianthus annuus]|nr:hypothetical protein HanRHA438_Chr04g0195431 [Helianthus annuus]
MGNRIEAPPVVFILLISSKVPMYKRDVTTGPIPSSRNSKHHDHRGNAPTIIDILHLLPEFVWRTR